MEPKKSELIKLITLDFVENRTIEDNDTFYACLIWLTEQYRMEKAMEDWKEEENGTEEATAD